MQQENLLR